MTSSISAADSAWFRQVLGQYPTGVSVITSTTEAGQPIGLAVGSFTSVSLDPPLVAFLPSTTSSTWPKIEKTGRFGVNILAADQEHLCRAFASQAPDKFAGVGWTLSASGVPILNDAVAWLDCDIDAVHEAGDHTIVVGRVRELDHARPTLPLLFFQGGYGGFSPRSLAVRDAQFRTQLRLVDRARPAMEGLARELDAQVAAAYCDGAELTMLASAGTPSDPDASSAAIGQHLQAHPPLGIWWAAFSPPGQRDAWLEAIESRSDRASYARALEQIKQYGYCLGLRSVRTAVDQLIDRRPGPSAASNEAPHEITLPDPQHYVPGRDRRQHSLREPADIVSLWAPTYTPDGQVALGLMITGFPPDERPLTAFAGGLLARASHVTELARNS